MSTHYKVHRGLCCNWNTICPFKKPMFKIPVGYDFTLARYAGKHVAIGTRFAHLKGLCSKFQLAMILHWRYAGNHESYFEYCTTIFDAWYQKFKNAKIYLFSIVRIGLFLKRSCWPGPVG